MVTFEPTTNTYSRICSQCGKVVIYEGQYAQYNSKYAERKGRLCYSCGIRNKSRPALQKPVQVAEVEPEVKPVVVLQVPASLASFNSAEEWCEQVKAYVRQGGSSKNLTLEEHGKFWEMFESKVKQPEGNIFPEICE